MHRRGGNQIPFASHHHACAWIIVPSSQMIPNDTRRFQMTPADPKSSETLLDEMISDDPKPTWSHMIPNSARWPQKWSQIIPDLDDPRWSQAFFDSLWMARAAHLTRTQSGTHVFLRFVLCLFDLRFVTRAMRRAVLSSCVLLSRASLMCDLWGDPPMSHTNTSGKGGIFALRHFVLSFLDLQLVCKAAQPISSSRRAFFPSWHFAMTSSWCPNRDPYGSAFPTRMLRVACQHLLSYLQPCSVNSWHESIN